MESRTEDIVVPAVVLLHGRDHRVDFRSMDDASQAAVVAQVGVEAGLREVGRQHQIDRLRLFGTGRHRPFQMFPTGFRLTLLPVVKLLLIGLDGIRVLNHVVLVRRLREVGSEHHHALSCACRSHSGEVEMLALIHI